MGARGLVALVVALTVAISPVATEVCEAWCLTCAVQPDTSESHHHHASHPAADHSMPGMQGHAHHHGASASPELAPLNTTLAGAPHPCSHADDLPGLLEAAHTSTVALAVLPRPCAEPAPDVQILRDATALAGPATALARVTTQLRI